VVHKQPQAQNSLRQKKHLGIAAEKQTLGGIKGGHCEQSDGSKLLSKKNIDSKASDPDLWRERA
jgi:hypothetical protein